MREFSTPLTVAVPGSGNLTDDVVRNAAEAPDAAGFGRCRETTAADGGADGGADEIAWSEVTWREFHEQVVGVAKGLVAAGVEAGDRVALLARTRYEWTLVDYAIWFAGAVTVPVYETSSADQVGWILADSGACAVVVESSEHVARVAVPRADLDALHHVWALDGGAVDVLTRLGDDVDDAVLEARRTTATPDDPATIIYTSGTTGRPKGCVLTHGNLRFELTVATAELHELFATTPVHGDDASGTGDADDDEDRDDGDATSGSASTLLFLPLAHVFARVIQVGCVVTRTRLGHHSDITHLQPALAGFRPTFVLAVPRVFEKVFNTASQRATADGRGPLFERSVEAAIAYSRALDRGRVPWRVRARHAVFSRLVYRRLRQALGGSCRYAVSGGAPLGERLGHFYRGIGLTVLEGYGLTETSAALTVNVPDAQKVGTVGRPLPGSAVRVDDDGELLVRGGQVFAGYWNDDAATAEVLDDRGWLRTGDVGEVDDEGFVRITGRKKEILVTAGGKNVAPAVLEDGVRAHPLVSQCLVVGDRRPFVAALVTIDVDAFAAWAEQHGKTGGVADLVDDDDLRAAVGSAVEEANKAVSRAEAIRGFVVLPDDWSEEGGQLTPSLKLKRAVVTREHRDDIAALYE